MKCTVDTCQNEAEQGYSLYQEIKSPTTHYTKVGQLCKSCFAQLTGEEPPKQESTHVKFCIECGIHLQYGFLRHDFACPICKGVLCSTCLLAHERRAHPKQEPEEEVFHCAKCRKKLSADRVVRHNGTVPYCAECYIEVILGYSPWKDEPKASAREQEKDFWEQEYSSYTYNTHYTRTQNAWTCVDCKKQFHQFITKNYAGKDQFCCDACYQKRQQEKAQSESARCEHIFGDFSYNPRFEFGTNPHAEDASEYIRRMYETIFGKESTAGTSSNTQQKQQQQTKQQSTTYTYIPTTTREAFKTLGIEPTADVAKIKKAYHALALKYHPDKPTGNAEKMKQINIANDLAMQFAGKK